MFGENYEALSYSEQYEVSARLLANPSLPSHKRRNMHPAVLSTMGGRGGCQQTTISMTSSTAQSIPLNRETETQTM